MNRRTLIILVIFLNLLFTSLAFSHFLHVYVYNANHHQPIPGATIYVKGQYYGKTGTDGYYYYSYSFDSRSLPLNVKVHAEGYKTQTRTWNGDVLRFYLVRDNTARNGYQQQQRASYDGFWSGQTNEGLEFSFRVQNSKVYNVHYNFYQPINHLPQSGGTAYQYSNAFSIFNGIFQTKNYPYRPPSGDFFRLRGTFSDYKNARGEFKIDPNTYTWSASKLSDNFNYTPQSTQQYQQPYQPSRNQYQQPTRQRQNDTNNRNNTNISGNTGTLRDIDGNIYKIVKIGNQWWMAENLRVTHYRNGDPIPNIKNNQEWASTNTGAYCAYDNDESYVDTYGYLYNGYAALDDRNVAPPGWHVPTCDDFNNLFDYLGGTWKPGPGGKLKEAGYVHWNKPNEGATNNSHFRALPAGSRYKGEFELIREVAYFWPSQQGEITSKMILSNDNSEIGWVGHADRTTGHSIRLIKD